MRQSKTTSRWSLRAGRVFVVAAGLAGTLAVGAAEGEGVSAGARGLEAFRPVPAPAPGGLLLRKGDRLAICGDSITEQKMYSRIMESYLTACVPELAVTVRQYGWGGERAPGFLARLTHDVLRFQPTVATTCYGMNDHEYRRYEERIGREYRAASAGIVRAFKAAGARVILGSPGCVGKVPPWSAARQSSVDDLNLNLCELRNLGIGLAGEESVGFADVFWPMLTAGKEAQARYGAGYAVAGKDGVHPGWAGSTVMAYAFLKAMGLDGDLGRIMVDLGAGRAEAQGGHEVTRYASGVVGLRSARYPFCAPKGAVDQDDTIRSGLSLVPFDRELNRLMLQVKGAPGRCRVTWGGTQKEYAREQLESGINLAAEFPDNPFGEAFARVDAAVAAKQAYETRQIKDLFHGPEGREDIEATVALTEKVRAPLAAAVRESLKPVEHEIRLEPIP